MSQPKNRDLSASKPAMRWGLNIPMEMVAGLYEEIPRAAVMRDFWTKMLGFFRGGGIRRRLLMWGLSLFGVSLLVVVVAGYSYMERQIRREAVALQSELASVTGEQIRTFVRRKIDRFSDNATALSLYPLGSKEQQLLLGLLVKNDSSFTHASIIDSQGMEVVKVSDRKVYFPSDLTDQSQSPKVYQSTQGGGLYKPGLHFDPGPAVRHTGDPALGRRAECRRRGFGRSRSLVSLGSDRKDSLRHCGLRLLSRREWKSNRA